MAYADFAAFATFDDSLLRMALVLLVETVVGAMLMVAVIGHVGRVADRRAPPLSSHHLITEEPSTSSVDLESETDFESRWGYHVDLGGRTSEEPWAPGPSAGEFREYDVSDVADWLAMHAPLVLNAAGVAHTCEVKGNMVRVVIPRLRESGFDVTVEAATFGVLVRTAMLFHAHFVPELHGITGMKRMKGKSGRMRNSTIHSLGPTLQNKPWDWYAIF